MLPPRLVDISITKILIIGLSRLMFSEKLLSHEQDFPETYLLDVWRLCSLQRKIRIDAAAICVAMSLNSFLANTKLAETHEGNASKLATQQVVQRFLSIVYGTRVSGACGSFRLLSQQTLSCVRQGENDHVDAFTLPSFTERIKADLSVLFSEYAQFIMDSSIRICLNVKSSTFRKM